MSNELKQAAQQALKELGEARKIVRASSSRQLAKDWDRRATDALANLRAALHQAEAQQPATGEPVAIGYINEMDELVKYPAPCIWMGRDCPRAKADRATHECYQRIYTHPAPSMPATPEPVLTVEKEPDYWASGHFYEGNKPYINPTKVWHLPIGTKLYTHPSPCEPSLIEKAISSGCFGVLPVKATIPMCKAGWGASGGELTFQQIGHIYEEMYKARPLPDA